MDQFLLRGMNLEVLTVLTLSDDVRLAGVVGAVVLALFWGVYIFTTKPGI